jgi:hypothetical protein
MTAASGPRGYHGIVKTLLHFRSFAILVCLSAFLLAALSPVILVGLFAFLVPAWLFFAEVVSFAPTAPGGGCAAPLFTFQSVFSPRPPPFC